LLLSICSAALGANALAASFDCEKAKSVAEQEICGSASLGKQDEDIASAYRKALALTRDPNQLRSEQRQWLENRDRCVVQVGVGSCSLDTLQEIRLQELTEPAATTFFSFRKFSAGWRHSSDNTIGYSSQTARDLSYFINTTTLGEDMRWFDAPWSAADDGLFARIGLDEYLVYVWKNLYLANPKAKVFKYLPLVQDFPWEGPYIDTPDLHRFEKNGAWTLITTGNTYQRIVGVLFVHMGRNGKAITRVDRLASFGLTAPCTGPGENRKPTSEEEQYEQLDDVLIRGLQKDDGPTRIEILSTRHGWCDSGDRSEHKQVYVLEGDKFIRHE